MLNSISKDSCSQEDVHLPDVRRNHCRNVAVYDLKGTSKAAELLSSQREGIDRKTCKRDSCSRKTESSHSCQIRQSPCSSCSTHSKAVDSEITWTTSRRLPLDVSACELDLFEDPKSNTFKVKSRTYKDSKRKRSAVYEEVKARPRRHVTDALRKIKSRSHKDSERQRGSVLEEQEVFHKRPVDGTLAENSSPDHRNTSTPPKKEAHYHRNHAKGGHGRQTKRLHESYPYDKDDILYFGASDFPRRCYEEKCVHHGAQDACPKISWREEDQRCRDDVDLYFRRHDKEYYLERGSIRCRDESIEGDWYYHERGIPAEKEGPLTYTRDGHWRRESITSNTMRRYDSDEFACESEHCDHFMQQECRGPSAYRKSRWDSWDEKYERRFSCFGKEVKSSSWRERHHNKSSDWCGLHFLGNSDGHRREMGHRSISSECNGEPFTDHERRQHTMSPQSHIYHSRTERRGRHDRKICVERFRDSGLCGSSDDAYKGENGITYPDDMVQFERRTNLGFKSYKFKPNEEELLFRHRDEVYFNNASYSYKRTMRQENIRVIRGSAHLHFDEKQLKLEKHKRGGSDNICVGTYADTVHSDKHQHSNVRCRDPVDLHLVVGKGKLVTCPGMEEDLLDSGYDMAIGIFSIHEIYELVIVLNDTQIGLRLSEVRFEYGVMLLVLIRRVLRNSYVVESRRHSKAGTSLCNGTQDDLYHMIDKECSIRELDYFHSEKVIHNGDPKVESPQNNEIWAKKCPVTRHDMASDLEEGQIVMDKLNEGHFMEVNIHASEGAVQAGCKDKNVEHDISSDGNKFVGEFGNIRILEMIAKMEKRRERFKEPISQKKEPDCNFDSEPRVNSLAETDETMPQRPARKRRWGGK
ncbi:hypothetical protein RJ641_004373 [Dillenia turbinata]|uniref:FIP1[III]-like protein n=1 Tax=Dillenia turbinata TaxID=194707 RepID=A0AAN8VBC3_9MAGN